MAFLMNYKEPEPRAEKGEEDVRPQAGRRIQFISGERGVRFFTRRAGLLLQNDQAGFGLSQEMGSPIGEKVGGRTR